jgi:hypothetical protein
MKGRAPWMDPREDNDFFLLDEYLTKEIQQWQI